MMRTDGNLFPTRHLREECGVFGVYSEKTADVASLSYYALYSLQHRGQESAGIVVNDDGLFHAYRDVGLVNEVFSADRLAALGQGNIAVGHVRYGTTGSDNKRNVQPIVVNHYKGRMALAHNGNLTNSHELRLELESRGSIFQTTTDSEVIAYIIVQERLTHGSIEEAVAAAMDRIQGAYSLVISSPSKLLAVRDPHGFRPLCMGKLKDGSVVFASETCALDAIGAAFVRDVEPGEIVVVDKTGVKSLSAHCGKAEKRLCVFEFIYFARPDSVIDGSSVHVARQRAGAFLALEHPVQADIVVGVPDSGLDAALGYSRQSGIPYGIGFIKNKYIGRTFISPTQTMRENEVNIKLNPVRSVVEGKRVVLIDDSIVRGTTCRRTIDLLRRAGAKEIHMRVSAPPFVAACYYGTDIDDPAGLIANNHSVEEIARIIGVDSLGYLSLSDVVKLADNTPGGFCTACFGGGYPTPVPADGGKDRFEYKISEREEHRNA
jgi:amidophosphoribosyltransferase